MCKYFLDVNYINRKNFVPLALLSQFDVIFIFLFLSLRGFNAFKIRKK